MPNTIPVCDRIKVGSTTKLLTEFLVTNGSDVNIPANSTFVLLYNVSGFKRVSVICRSSSSYTLGVLTGWRYSLFSGVSLAVLMSGSDLLMNVIDSVSCLDSSSGFVEIYDTCMTFTV